MEDLLKDVELIGAINYANWGIGLVLLLVYTAVMQQLFRRFALVASNRRLFASQFMYYAISIFLIITTIKSSLALSLGLVGALSIIRFRTAIKEPEQIIFLLALTAIAISLAAEQFVLSSLAVLVFAIIAIIRHQGSKKQDWVHQDFLVIEFEQDNADIAQGVLEQLIGLNEIESLSHYSNESGSYRLVFRIEDAQVNLIPKIEGIIRASEAMNASVRLTQSAV
ncbi:MAG: DUF4956 domain-containing protein [Bacteroidia bacterium]|jgi:uncharacterized membrane protein|nr:DUF4956 domain-containing protein [Bacteroidia bacterium]MDA8628638.1 DUF4956 domain-containing protein [Bacteroidia bacterium]MDA9213783.1 DUF4956 domain-containing protein [Bacteroidia bacterium]MDG1747415.1 DUF4956 domain-containing protein [Bacteroidia bacterium]